MKKQIKEQIVDDGVREKMANLLNTLKNTANNIENDWNSKERENYIYNQVKLLNFVEDGEFILKDKSIVNSLKKAYHSKNLGEFTTKTLSDYFNGVDENLIYILKEPFGSKASPDFLFITSKGVVGVEDKSSKNGKVSFNTGTPGGNKFIMYYDRKLKTIYLITGKQWGWENTIESEYKQFTKDMINYAKKEFEKKFGSRIKNMEYYARPMLVDKNKIDAIRDKDELDVIDMLQKYL
jgi:hypothetical protein